MYLAGLATFGVLVGGATLNSALMLGLLRPKVLLFAGVISLLMTVPLFQYLVSRRTRVAKPKREPVLRLWMLGVVGGSVAGICFLFYTYSYSVAPPGDAAAVAGTSLGVSTTTPRTYLPPDLPKFGGVQKTFEQIAADETYVSTMLAQHTSVDDALARELAIGWEAFKNRDGDLAMRSFNRAWLLSATSSDAVRGMGLVEGVRGHFDSSIALMQEALVLDPSRTVLNCDIALSYFNTNHLDEAQEAMRRVEEANAMNTVCYKTAAKIARAQGDEARAVMYEQEANTSTSAE